MTGWQTKTIREVTGLIKDGTHGTHNDTPGGIPLLSAKDINNGRVVFNNSPRLISQKDFNSIHKAYQLIDGDILLTIVGSLGRVARVKNYNNSYTLQRSVAILRFKDTVVYDQFAYYMLSAHGFQKELMKRESKGAQGGVYLGEIAKIKVNLPPKSKQEQIASILLVWDKYLEELDKKIVMKEEMKKGLAQQLLTGKSRLPSFNTEWTNITLGDLYDITSSKRVFEADWTHEGVPFYRAREVIKLHDNGHVDNELFISEKMFNDYKAKYGSVKPDDILVTGVGTIGIAYRVKDFTNFYFKDGNIIWLKDKGRVSSSFIEHLFDSPVIKRQIHKLTPVTTVATYTIEMANATKILLPPRDEQDAISDVLNSAAKEIAHYKKVRGLVAQQKQYLLKNLISGEIRTPETLTLKGAN